MTDKKDKKGTINGVNKAGSAKGVKATESISEIDKVREATAVQGVSGISGIRGTSGVGAIRFDQRDKLYTMISQEADKLAAQGIIPKSQREVVEKAVQMAIDAALVEDDAEGQNKKKS